MEKRRLLAVPGNEYGQIGGSQWREIVKQTSLAGGKPERADALMSPAMVAAAAVEGKVVDVRNTENRIGC